MKLTRTVVTTPRVLCATLCLVLGLFLLKVGPGVAVVGGRTAAAESPDGSMTVVSVSPLRDIEDRPIDVAIFPDETIRDHIRVPRSDGDAKFRPWIQRACKTIVGEQGPGDGAGWYWSIAAPAEIKIDLGRPCYITEVIVQPLSLKYGISGFEMKLVSDDRAELDTIPPATVSVTTRGAGEYDRPGSPLIARFKPVLAQKLELQLTSDDGSVSDMIYVRDIRILGKPRESTMTAPALVLSEELRRSLNERARNLAAADSEAPPLRVCVSEDRYPNGRFDIPWLAPGATELGELSSTPYWCASQPAWVEVDLGRECYVNEVRVYPFSEAFGLTEFYMKAFDDAGDEVDTTPPCSVAAPPVGPLGTGFRPSPLRHQFQPVLTSKLKFYFKRGGFKNDLIYIEKIEILGLPKDE